MEQEPVYKIFVISVESEKAGNPHGAWIILNGKNENQICSEIREILSSASVVGSEWAIREYDLGGVSISEHESVENLVNVLDAISEFGDAFFAGARYYEWKKAIGLMETSGCYLGAYDNKIGWAFHHLKSTGALETIPQFFRDYIDFEKYARDMEFVGGIEFVPYKGKYHVFRSR